jgi:predicted enzyme related to lactoylglutathione lyase
MKARVGRLALEVADVDQAAADFAALFDMDFQFLEVPSQAMRVAIGEHGLEFVQITAPGWAPNNGPGLLMGVCIAVEDVERSRTRLVDKGHEIVMEIPLKSGRNEYVFKPIHGVPVMIYQEAGTLDLGTDTLPREKV